MFYKAFSSCCIFEQFLHFHLGASLWRLNRQLNLQLIYYITRYIYFPIVGPSLKYSWIGFGCQSALFQEPLYLCLSFRFCFHLSYNIVWFWWNFEFHLISVLVYALSAQIKSKGLHICLLNHFGFVAAQYF